LLTSAVSNTFALSAVLNAIDAHEHPIWTDFADGADLSERRALKAGLDLNRIRLERMIEQHRKRGTYKNCSGAIEALAQTLHEPEDKPGDKDFASSNRVDET
jgi:hypothetical protein